MRSTALLVACFLVVGGAQGSSAPSDTAFMTANDTVMSGMMKSMHVRPSGNVDRDFVAMMVPHHEGAIGMARLELQYGQDETLRRLAQEIIVTQQEEIAAMRLALGKSAQEH